MSDRTDAPALGPLEFARWIWRQLTSMRTALFLLFLLALAAIPGSVIPQDNVDNILSSQWRTEHKTLTPIYEKLQLFNVYSSVWFSAIYILLLISLVGCVLPRLAVYWRGLRAKPPAAPKNLARLSAHQSWTSDDDVVAAAAKVLRRRRFRVQVAPDGRSVAAERGYLREAGNLLFHLSVLVVLFGVAASKLFGFEGGVIVVTGNGFSNSLSQYDSFQSGGLFQESSLAPFAFTVKNFHANYIETGREAGMAHEFDATVNYQTSPGAPSRTAAISVNHPLTIDGTQIYLISHGYAPLITVRDGQGNVVYSGPTVFLPEGQDFRSFGVVKVPDSRTAAGRPLQLGLQGEFYPTYAFTMQTGPISLFPRADNPAISMLVYEGDLGLDSGAPQNVYTLSMKGLKSVQNAKGKPLRLDLMKGDTAVLPGGRGSVTFDGVSQFVKLQISQAPDSWVALLGMCLALLGLLGSLFVRPRRIWVRRDPDSGLVEIAALDRSSGGDPAPEVEDLAKELGRPAGEPVASVEGGA
ncbi:MAG: cytochrome c biogenesis protein ResB [Marmoricola sp.]